MPDPNAISPAARRRRWLGVALALGALWAAGLTVSSLTLLVRGETVVATVTDVTCQPWESYQVCRATITYPTVVHGQTERTHYGFRLAPGDTHLLRYDPARPDRIQRGGAVGSALLAAVYGSVAGLLAVRAWRLLEVGPHLSRRPRRRGRPDGG